MAIAIKIKRVSSPRSIEDLKKMRDSMLGGEPGSKEQPDSDEGFPIPEDKNEIPDDDEAKKDDKGPDFRNKSDADNFKPDGNEQDNPQPRNTKIDDYKEFDKKAIAKEVKLDPHNMLGLAVPGMDGSPDDEDGDERDSLKMFLKGLLGLM